MLPWLRSESKASDFTSLLAAIRDNSLLAGSLSPLNPYVVTILIKKNLSPRINRAWLHKDLNGWDFQ